MWNERKSIKKIWKKISCMQWRVDILSKEGGRHCFILASDKNKKDQKNLRSKLTQFIAQTWNKQNRLKTTNHESQTMTFWTSESKHVFPKRSAVMVEGTEKPKIPSKFAKHTARYNEFHCKITLKKIEKSILRCKKTINSPRNNFAKNDLHTPKPAQLAQTTATTTRLTSFPYYRLTNSKVFS